MTNFIVPSSRVRLHSIPAGVINPADWALHADTHNQALGWWGYAAALALSRGGPEYRIRKLYIEFMNVASSGDLVPVPTVTPLDPAEGIDYYTALASSPSHDYLRVNLLTTPEIAVESGYEDYFQVGQGNLLRLYAQAADSVGQNGKSFDAAHLSKVYGTALVVSPVESDPTQDIVVARAYFSGGEQQLKVNGLQLGVSWEVPFVLP